MTGSFAPSQVLSYIDRVFPNARSGGMCRNNIGKQYIKEITLLRSMLASLPAHIITLSGNAYVEFSESVVALDIAVGRWAAGDYALERRYHRNEHPIELIRKHLAALRDEGIAPTVDDLTFVADTEMRDILRRDISAVHVALAGNEWKAATVLAGSVAEALLLDALTSLEKSEPGRPKEVAQRLLDQEPRPLKKLPRGALDTWTLSELTEVAFAAGLIREQAAGATRLARDFRNLIHPGRERKESRCDVGTAHVAVGAINLVIRDLVERSG